VLNVRCHAESVDSKTRTAWRLGLPPREDSRRRRTKLVWRPALDGSGSTPFGWHGARVNVKTTLLTCYGCSSMLHM